MGRNSLIFLCVISVASPVFAQPDPKTITIFSDIPPSSGQETYVDILADELVAGGFAVSSREPISIDPGRLRWAIHEAGSALGLTSLQSQLGEGDVAAALLSTPGAYNDLEGQRGALRGVIGDAARDEINDGEVYALRLWPHSTAALLSKTELASIGDFQGVMTVTGDPYSASFIKSLGATPLSMAFAEVSSGLLTGVADAAVAQQGLLQDEIINILSEGSILPDYKINTGVTLTSTAWWHSLTAGEQRRLLHALEVAETAAAARIMDEATRTTAQTLEHGIRTVSWEIFDATALHSAVADSIYENTQADPAPILELRDNIEALQQRTGPDTDRYDADREGSLNQPARVFFASNRRFDRSEPLLADQFANSKDRENVLRCGELAPADAGVVGHVSGQVALIGGSSVAEGDACISLISDASQELGGKALVHVHGYRNTFDDAVRAGLAFSRDAEIGGVIIIWSWPSAGNIGSYIEDGERVAISEQAFQSFFASLAASQSIDQIDFVAHSMGSRLVANLMRDAWTSSASAVVLAAADLSRDYLDQAVQAAQAASVTVLATEGDRALLASQVVHSGARVGQAKPLFLRPGLDTIDLSAFDRRWSKNHGHAFLERNRPVDTVA